MNSAILIWRTCLKDWNISHLNYFENILGEIFSFQKMHRHFWNSSSSTTTAGSFNKRHVLQNILCKHLGRDHFDCTVLCILLILHSSTLSWPWLGWMTLQPISYSNWKRRDYQEGLSILIYLKNLSTKERIPRGSVYIEEKMRKVFKNGENTKRFCVRHALKQLLWKKLNNFKIFK